VRSRRGELPGRAREHHQARRVVAGQYIFLTGSRTTAIAW
jgi:hypothetical protein